MTSAGTQGDTRYLSFGVSVEAVEQFQVETSGAKAQFEGQGVWELRSEIGDQDPSSTALATSTSATRPWTREDSFPRPHPLNIRTNSAERLAARS